MAAADGEKPLKSNQFDLSWLPPVYILITNLSLDEQHQAEETLAALGAPLTYDIKEAKVIFGNIEKARRARLELRWKGLNVEEMNESEPTTKKRRISDEGESGRTNAAADKTPSLPDLGPDDVIVIRLGWLTAVTTSDKLLPLEPDIILHGRKVRAPSPSEPSTAKPIEDHSVGKAVNQRASSTIVERAKADPQPKLPYSRHPRRDRNAEAAKHDIVGKSFSPSKLSRPIHLTHATTSEDCDTERTITHPMPEWVLQNKIYSCERCTPFASSNSEFIELLKIIRLARELILDHIGVRAYSTSIASLAAWPYPLQSSQEVLHLPGCDSKIAHLFYEYKTTGQLQAVLDINADPALTCLRSFYDIWGVGAITAREFYYDRGWRDLDDIIEYGWKSLSRVQQIGLKYYDEFKETLTRVQVEGIAATIADHAARVTDSNVQMAIVGGYRRGKSLSNDVDVILSHPDESQTMSLITRVVNSLEKDGWITHTLTLNSTTTNRGQGTLPINTGTAPGHGFDSLDKALVVWQSPTWPTQAADLPANPKCKNPNPHRRVDIIISPWRTVGCAVAGWTSGTTFQRDLRRYCKYKKGWKFDSSGVRERGTGAWVDLERYRNVDTRCKTWEEAEKRVFEGLGLEWMEPWDRCTG